MTETLKINLTKAYTSLKIMSAVAGALFACFAVYMSIDNRMDKIEQEQAVNKGVQLEWRRNIENKVDNIYNIVKEWSPIDGQAKKETKRKTEEEI